MEFSLRALTRLFSPAVLLLLVVILVFNQTVIDGGITPYLGYLPYPLLLAAAMLSQQFNRGRTFAAALLLLLAYLVIQLGLQSPLEQTDTQRIYGALSLAVPLSVLVLLLLPERGLWNGFGLLTLATVPLLFVGSYLLFGSQLPLLDSPWLQLWPRPEYVLSTGSSGLFALVALACLFCLCWRNSEAEVNLLAVLAALFLTLAFFDQPHISALLCSAGALCLVVGLLGSSRDMAFRDELTSLRNRRAFDERLKGLGRRYVIATLDVDHFKKFNDKHGHDVGDEVLKMVAAHIDRVGGGGTAYRYGGEEFCIVFSGKSVEACEAPLEAVRQSIESYRMALRNQQSRPQAKKAGRAKRKKGKPRAKTVQVTISIGAAQRGERYKQPEEVLKASDKALYRAKKKGRNCLQLDKK